MKQFTCKKKSRLDIFLANEFENSRNQINKLIRDNGVFVNDKLVKKTGLSLVDGDIVRVKIPKTCISKPIYDVDFDIEILYEDDDILVVNKPPFLTVHPAKSVKEATLVDWLKKKNIRLSTISGEERHGIVHRIDKQTSGALVVAKTNKAHENLSLQLENKTMGRYYLAIIDLPLKDNIIVKLPIARDLKNRLKMAVLPNGRFAKTAFYNLLTNQNDKTSLILAKLYTGRTHQIRVHLKSLSRHILGDDLYGFKSQKAKISRVMLHAYLLYLEHPISKKLLHVKAPFFDDFANLVNKKFLRNTDDEIFKSDSIFKCFDDVDKWLSNTTNSASC